MMQKEKRKKKRKKEEKKSLDFDAAKVFVPATEDKIEELLEEEVLQYKAKKGEAGDRGEPNPNAYSPGFAPDE